MKDDAFETWLLLQHAPYTTHPSYIAKKSREGDADHVEQDVERLSVPSVPVDTKGRRHE